MSGLRPVVNDEQLAVLRLLVDRRPVSGVRTPHPDGRSPAPPAAARTDPRRREEGPLPPVRPRHAATPRSVPATAVGKTRRPAWPAELISETSSGSTPARRQPTKSSPSSSSPPVLGYSSCPVSARLAPPGGGRVGDITRFPNKPTTRPGTAPHPSTRPPETRSVIGSHGRTDRSTGSCTSWPASRSATPASAVTTTTARRPTAKHHGGHAMHQTPALRHRLPADAERRQEAHGDGPGEGNRETTRLQRDRAHIPTSALRTSHFPDPHQSPLKRPLRRAG